MASRSPAPKRRSHSSGEVSPVVKCGAIAAVAIVAIVLILDGSGPTPALPATTTIRLSGRVAPVPDRRPAPPPGLMTVTEAEPVEPPPPPMRQSLELLPDPFRAEDGGGTTLFAGFEGSPRNLMLSALGPGRFLAKFPSGGRNLIGSFVFRLEGAAGKRIEIGLRNVPIAKWWSVNPVTCDGFDLTDPRAYESRRPMSVGPMEQGTNGPALPDTSLQHWHFVPEVTADKSSRELKFVVEPRTDRCYVAMRPPFVPSMVSRLYKRWESDPRCTVHRLGWTERGYELAVVEVRGRSDSTRRSAVLAVAREHGDEHDASWCLAGMIESALAGRFAASPGRTDVDLFAIPMFDPDGAALSAYHRIVDTFVSEEACRESLVYANFLEKTFFGGRSIDVVLNLHNVESAEAGHLFCFSGPSVRGYRKYGLEMHARVKEKIGRRGPIIGKGMPAKNFRSRIGGWCERAFGSLFMFYEVNAQQKDRHLTIAETKEIGALMLAGVREFLGSRNGKKFRRDLTRLNAEMRRASERQRRDSLLAPNSPFDRERSLRTYMAETSPLPSRR